MTFLTSSWDSTKHALNSQFTPSCPGSQEKQGNKINPRFRALKTNTGLDQVVLRGVCCFPNLEKTLGSPLDCKEIKPVNPKGNQLCIFIGRADAEAEAPKLWPSDVKNRLIGKNSDAGRD